MSEFDQFSEIKTESNIGLRFLAGFIDYFIIYSFSFYLIFTFGEPSNDGSYTLSGAPALIPVLIWFIMTVGLEFGLGGTLGNSLVGLKVIPMNGKVRNLTFGESFKRHLLDPIDMFFFGLVGVLTIKNNRKNQRVGDLWAQTIVVKAKTLN
tara:strand:- start:152 stop:604 length:453 start_codon:yes stop_codon:yes gene_type:complete